MSNADATGELDVDVSSLETHATTVQDLRLNELVRVTADGVDIERGEVIAKWPYTQHDLKGENHTEDVYTSESRRKVKTEDGSEWVAETHHKFNGHRATIATPDGGRYAAVNWSRTDDPAIIYMLVIDADEPDERRWTKIGVAESIERYGPQPSYEMSAMWWRYTRDVHVEALKLAISGELETEYGYRLADRRSELRALKSARRADSPQPLTREQIFRLAAACEAVRDHVLNTGDPIASESVSDDAKALRMRPNPAFHTAVFPDGSGGWITSERNPTGQPSDDIPPTEQEQDADPDFRPLTERSDANGN